MRPHRFASGCQLPAEAVHSVDGVEHRPFQLGLDRCRAAGLRGRRRRRALYLPARTRGEVGSIVPGDLDSTSPGDGRRAARSRLQVLRDSRVRAQEGEGGRSVSVRLDRPTGTRVRHRSAVRERSADRRASVHLRAGCLELPASVRHRWPERLWTQGQVG